MRVFARTCFAIKREDFITIERAMRITGATETKLLHLRKLGRFRQPTWSRAGSEGFVIYDDVLKIRQQKSKQYELDYEYRKSCIFHL